MENQLLADVKKWEFGFGMEYIRVQFRVRPQICKDVWEFDGYSWKGHWLPRFPISQGDNSTCLKCNGQDRTRCITLSPRPFSVVSSTMKSICFVTSRSENTHQRGRIFFIGGRMWMKIIGTFSYFYKLKSIY